MMALNNLGEIVMNKFTGFQFMNRLREIESAEQYLIARTHRELAANQTKSSSGVDMSVIALSAYALIFMSCMVMIAGHTTIV